MNVQPVKNITVDDILDHLKELDFQMSELDKKKADALATLNFYIENDVNTQLADKEYGCGTATIDTNKYKVKYVVSKKIKYDQTELSNIVDRIQQSGLDASEYVKISYDVAESKFKAWPSNIQKEFLDARTVETSKPRISYEVKE
jgi:hypothetical protein